MAKKRKNAKSSANAKGLSIPEEEQWRIVNETGVLSKVQILRTPSQRSATGDNEVSQPTLEERPVIAEEIFNAIFLIIPFSFLLLMMDMLVHRQFSRPYSISIMLDRMIPGIPILSLFIFYSNRYKSNRLVQAGLFLASVVVGCRIFWMVNRGRWLQNIQQCPPLGTAWVLAILQLDLGPAVLSLAVVAAWVKYEGLNLTF